MRGSSQLRLFVALDPPGAIRAMIEELAEPLRDVVWTPPHQYHLTLRFLGATDTAMRTPIENALSGIKVESFILPLTGMGTFPSLRSPRVLWVGVGNAHPRLFQLRQRVDDALIACGLDFDVRTFHPHITVARCARSASPHRIARLIRHHREFEGPSFRIDAFTLYASEPKRTGVVHTPLLRVPLRGGRNAR